MATGTYYGYNIPFFSRKRNEPLTRHIDEKLIRRDLLQLLLTSPGERVMRPFYGTEIRSYLFDPSDQVAMDVLRSGIREAVSTYERRVTITEIIIVRGEDENVLRIKVYGRYNLDRFQVPRKGDVKDMDLLVELDVNTAKVNEL